MEEYEALDAPAVESRARDTHWTNDQCAHAVLLRRLDRHLPPFENAFVQSTSHEIPIAHGHDMPTSNTRIEHDLLGDFAVPADAYYGVQTARALENFKISGVELRLYPNFIKALAMVKLGDGASELRHRRLLEGHPHRGSKARVRRSSTAGSTISSASMSFKAAPGPRRT